MSGRVGLHDTGMDVLYKLSEGNPGALTVLLRWMKEGAAIDPDAMLPPLLQMLSLDDIDVVGPKIWILYKDICGSDLRRFLGVLRAHQLGFLSTYELKVQLHESRLGRLDVDTLMSKVEERLPNFRKAPVEVAK